MAFYVTANAQELTWSNEAPVKTTTTDAEDQTALTGYWLDRLMSCLCGTGFGQDLYRCWVVIIQTCMAIIEVAQINLEVHKGLAEIES